ncbi:MAG: DUF3047 domain-containing protein [Candidatus Binatia bacterium]
MRPWLAAIPALVVAVGAWAHQPWREDFRAPPTGWEIRTVPRTKVTDFRTDPTGADGTGVLLMEAPDASGTFATQLKGVDLQRTPILRWRWRVKELPTDADGRNPERDDQAIGIYVSYGGILGQRSIAYRWETDTPVGTEGDATYGAGIVKVHWITVRNQQDGTGQFHVEERNVAADFQRVFGFVPTDPIIAVSSNSQYTESRATAELDWIELAAGGDPRARVRPADARTSHRPPPPSLPVGRPTCCAGPSEGDRRCTDGASHYLLIALLAIACCGRSQAPTSTRPRPAPAGPVVGFAGRPASTRGGGPPTRSRRPARAAGAPRSRCRRGARPARP